MPAPATGRDLHVDVPLSNIVVGRRPEGFIADQLLPITNVGKQSDMYYKFQHLEWYRHESGQTLRAPATKAKKVHMNVSSDTYYTPNYALATDWPVEDQVNADAVLQWARSSAEFLTDRLMMDYEMRVADLAVASSNVSTILVPASGWSQAAHTQLSDMLGWVDDFKTLTGLMPNTVIIPRTVLTSIRQNDQFRDVLFGDRGGLATAEQIAGLIGVDRVIVPTSQVNTAVEADPQDGTLSNIWDGTGNMWLARINTLSGMFTDTWLNAFRWTSPMFGVPFAVQRHPFDAEAKKFTVEVGYYQAEKVVSSDLAMRVSSLLST
jgi:hypothetical protein